MEKFFRHFDLFTVNINMQVLNTLYSVWHYRYLESCDGIAITIQDCFYKRIKPDDSDIAPEHLCKEIVPINHPLNRPGKRNS